MAVGRNVIVPAGESDSGVSTWPYLFELGSQRFLLCRRSPTTSPSKKGRRRQLPPAPSLGEETSTGAGRRLWIVTLDVFALLGLISVILLFARKLSGYRNIRPICGRIPRHNPRL